MQAEAKRTRRTRPQTEETSLAFKRHILEKTAGFASEPMADLYRVQMLGMMLNRHEELLKRGLGDKNACQRVLHEFADIADRMRDMGFDALEKDEPVSGWPQITQEEAERYLDEQDAYQHRIAMGSALCTACVSPLMLVTGLSKLLFGRVGDAVSLFGAVGMFGMIALGVYLIVTAVKPEHGETIKKGRFSLSSRLRERLERLSETMEKKARSHKGKGVVMLVMCVVPVLLGAAVDEMLGFGSDVGVTLSTVGMFLLIAAGVYELVMADGEKKTIRRLLDKRE